MENIKKTVDLAEEITKEVAEDVAEEKAPVEEVEEVTEEVKEEVAPEEKSDAPEETPKPDEQNPVGIDYDKLASIVSGKQTATEDSVLKGYFKKQGLSPEEMTQAIDTFKKMKAESTPDVEAIQHEAMHALQRALNAEVQNKAMLMAGELGVEVKAIPYIVKMSNIEDVTEGGAVNEEKLRASLEEVIQAIPSLKKSAVQGGFQVVGADTTQNAQASTDDELERAFGVKR